MKRIIIFIMFNVIVITCFAQGDNYYDLKPFQVWNLSSIPFKQPDLFPESYLQNNITLGFNRAKICWYSIDPLFLRNNSLTPQHIIDDPLQQENHFTREIVSGEVYPSSLNPDLPVATFDIGFYPSEKGPYNYDVIGIPDTSAGIAIDGTLNNPHSRWAGIMRPIDKNIFSDQNLNYLAFWLMDPFVYNPSQNGGYLYFNIGNVSEDVLKDCKKSYENGLPTDSLMSHVDTTAWGIVSDTIINGNIFSSIVGSRQYQDVGLDGLGDLNEISFFYYNYLHTIETFYGSSSSAYSKAMTDPSSDDYHYYRGSDYDAAQVSIIERYKNYNNYDGNSPTAGMMPEPYITSYSDIPNNEDINQNSNLDTLENYYQYKIVLNPDSFIVGQNFITDKITVTPANGDGSSVSWYKFLIPLNTNKREIIGNINSLDSSGFVRLFFKEFSDQIILRFLELAFVTTDLTTVEEIPNNSAIKIFPNPSDGAFTITYNTLQPAISIYNSLGKLVYKKEKAAQGSEVIDVSGLAEGMYIVKVSSAKGVLYNGKLVIQKCK